MPTSDPRVIEAGCGEIIFLNPKSVLDIGMGYGKWGALAREYTDIWQGRFYVEEWETRITGIEVHRKYKNPMWGVYDAVILGNAVSVVDNLKANGTRYDLAIMMEVLEHFEKEAGKKLVMSVLDICDNFLVSWCNSEQKDVRDNKYEDHVSKWEASDFVKMGVWKTVIIRNERHDLGNWGVVRLSNKKG
jgi:hypothetical protein